MSADQEEALREAACIGNLEEVESLLKLGVDINSTNKVNGWTALHWAAKRGHVEVVQTLLKGGADMTIVNTSEQVAADLTRNEHIRTLFGAPLPLEAGDSTNNENTWNFKPNYLANPEFLYSKATHTDTSRSQPLHNRRPEGGFIFHPLNVTRTKGNQWSPSGLVIHPDFIVLCVRLANLTKSNSDFTEVEISRRDAPSLANLTEILCDSLECGIKPEHVHKIRKLPNTVLKKDRDVLRLTDYQMLEIILQPQVVHPLDGVITFTGAPGNPEDMYLKEHVSKLIY